VDPTLKHQTRRSTKKLLDREGSESLKVLDGLMSQLSTMSGDKFSDIFTEMSLLLRLKL